jgi:uncharacterized RDD family membrane protein YckC
MASTAQRLLAYLIDVVPIVVLGLILGSTSTTAIWIAAAYLLLRDVGGASPGKLVLRLRVVGKDGASATVAQRVLRNVTLGAQAAAIAVVPLAGFGLMGLIVRFVPSLLLTIDGAYLLDKGLRLSDRLVGTRVVGSMKHGAPG